MQLDLVTLRVFVSVMEDNSIVGAAERVHLAASAISKRLSDLEQILKTPLFLREKNKLIPTPAAFNLLFHARTVMRDLDVLQQEMGDFSVGARGHVRLLANLSAIAQYIPQDISSFTRRYPLIRIELQDAISPKIVRAVAESAADVGIYAGNFPAPDLEVMPYRREVLLVATEPGHPLASRPAVRFVDMLPYDIVRVKAGSSIDTLVEKAAAELGVVVRSRIRVSGWEAVCSMVEAGMGIGLIPEKSARRYLKSMGIALVAFDEPWGTRQLNLCVRSFEGLAPAARLFVEHLRDRNGGKERSP